MSWGDKLPKYRCGCGQRYSYDPEYDSVCIELAGPHGTDLIADGPLPGYFGGWGSRSIFAPEKAHVPCPCGRELWFVNQPRLFAVGVKNG